MTQREQMVNGNQSSLPRSAEPYGGSRSLTHRASVDSRSEEPTDGQSCFSEHLMTFRLRAHRQSEDRKRRSE